MYTNGNSTRNVISALSNACVKSQVNFGYVKMTFRLIDKAQKLTAQRNRRNSLHENAMLLKLSYKKEHEGWCSLVSEIWRLTI